MSSYIGSKLLHGLISMCLSYVVYRLGMGALLFLVPLFLSFPRKYEKRGSNSTASVV